MSIPFCTTLDLQLSFYRPLCYNSSAHCPLLLCIRTTSAILAGAHSYFVVSSFKYEGKNSCHDLILNPRFYRPLCYNSRAHCPLLQCLRVSAIGLLAGAHSYFVVWLFKCEGENSCHDLISNKSRYILIETSTGLVMMLPHILAALDDLAAWSRAKSAPGPCPGIQLQGSTWNSKC